MVCSKWTRLVCLRSRSSSTSLIILLCYELESSSFSSSIISVSTVALTSFWCCYYCLLEDFYLYPAAVLLAENCDEKEPFRLRLRWLMVPSLTEVVVVFVLWLLLQLLLAFDLYSSIDIWLLTVLDFLEDTSTQP